MTSIDIMNIKQITVNKHDVPKTYESLSEYLKIAKRLITKHAPKIRADLSHEMLNNDDAIANIAFSVMLADWKYNGQGTLHGYRKYCAINAIKNYLTRSLRQQKTVEGIDFDDITSHSNDYNTYDTQDYVNNILKTHLTPKEAEFMKMYYIDNYKMREIAEHFNITTQAVSSSILNAKQKLKTVYNIVEG